MLSVHRRAVVPTPASTLETSPQNAYSDGMSNATNRASIPAGWSESLARSKAQIAAGQTVPLVPVLDRLRTAADRLEAESEDVPQDGAEQTLGR